MKINFRTIIALLFVIFFLVFSMPLHLVVWLIGKKNPMKKYRISYKVIDWAFSVVLWCAGIKTNVIGLENVPTDQPVLFVSNHRSNLDILATQTTCGIPVGFVAKKELGKIPLLGLWMQDIGCVFLDRANIKSAVKVMNDGAEHIKTGCSMTICPEGTRGHDEGMKEFKDGSLKIATKAMAPVVPVAVIGTDDHWENNPGGIKLTKGYITICYGKPIDLTTLEADEKKHLGKYTQKFVEELYEAHKAEHAAIDSAYMKK